MSTFAIGEKDFTLDGEPFQIISGAIHYFRVHPDSWRDRIRKAKLMGLNTIETYVAWNFHAPTEDQFLLDGNRDLGRFLDIIAQEGLYAIVRPGPYICAEWDNGGLPAWLTAKPGIVIRTNEPIYFSAVERFLHHLGPVLQPRQINNGGPIILFQIENEYGAYGNDKDYLKHLVQVYQDLGFVVPFTTVDQPEDEMLQNGSLPELHMTGSFGSRSLERLETLRKHQKTGPLMCSEFWIGWFDHWGAHHHTATIAEAAQSLDELLSSGASVNFYMFHGGTNYGFTNGANDKGVYQPLVTSYDYDAPLAEDGYPTDKYWAFRDVIAKYAPVPTERPEERVDSPVFTTELSSRADWLSLPGVAERASAITGAPAASYEALNHDGPFVLYEHEVNVSGPASLVVNEIRDLAQVFLDDVHVGTLFRDHHDRFVTLPTDAQGTLRILVEDQGRVNYGPRLGESKGLGTVHLNGHELTSWSSTPYQLDGHTELDFTPITDNTVSQTGPVFLAGQFELESPVNLFIDTTHWGKGNVWVNGFNLGRYWARGPQHTLFVPKELLSAGTNSITVFEVNGVENTSVNFVAKADLGHTDF